MMLMKKKVISAIDDLETAIRKIDAAGKRLEEDLLVTQFATYEEYVKIKAIKEQIEELTNKLAEVI